MSDLSEKTQEGHGGGGLSGLTGIDAMVRQSLARGRLRGTGKSDSRNPVVISAKRGEREIRMLYSIWGNVNRKETRKKQRPKGR